MAWDILRGCQTGRDWSCGGQATYVIGVEVWSAKQVFDLLAEVDGKFVKVGQMVRAMRDARRMSDADFERVRRVVTGWAMWKKALNREALLRGRGQAVARTETVVKLKRWDVEANRLVGEVARMTVAAAASPGTAMVPAAPKRVVSRSAPSPIFVPVAAPTAMVPSESGGGGKGWLALLGAGLLVGGFAAAMGKKRGG